MHFTIRREPGAAAISLDEWTAFVESSPILKPAPPKEGINPFTKQPVLFHPAPGSAYFDGAGGQCSFGFRDGALAIDASAADRDAIAQIAKELNAVIEIDVDE